MMDANIIGLVEESEWINLMVVHDKNTNKIRIWIDLRKLNDTSLHNPFSTPFIDLVLEGLRGK